MKIDMDVLRWYMSEAVKRGIFATATHDRRGFWTAAGMYEVVYSLMVDMGEGEEADRQNERYKPMWEMNARRV